MPFLKKNKGKWSMELIALVDMVFVLLIFFILTFIVAESSFQEKAFYIPVPKQDYVQGQALVQLLDNDRVFYIDDLDIETIERLYANNYSPQQIKGYLESHNVITFNRLYQKLDRIHEDALQNKDREYFIIIRSPGDLSYTHAMTIMARLSNYGLFNLKYGCVGGEQSDITYSNSTPRDQNFGTYSRKMMQIDFSSP